MVLYIQDLSETGAAIVFTTNEPSIPWIKLTDDEENSKDYYAIEMV